MTRKRPIIHVLFLISMMTGGKLLTRTASSTWTLNASTCNATNIGNITGTAIVKGSGVCALSYSADGGKAAGWASASRDLNDYYEYAVTPNVGKDFTLSTISFYCGRT